MLDGLAGRPKLAVLDTMNYWIASAKPQLLEVLRRVDVLVLNDGEARELAGTPNLVRAAQVIRGLGPPSVVIKKGEHGALLFDGGGVFVAPAYPLENVFDPTGAGDTFAGGFVGSLAASGARDAAALRRAVVHGSALASFTVEKFGPERLRSVTREELDERTKAFRALTEF